MVNRRSIATLVTVVPIVTLAADPSWRVTPTKVEDYPGGFRCYFRSPAEKPDTPRFLFQANDENGDQRAQERGLIGIDGVKIVLERVVLRRRNKSKGPPNVGDQLHERFTAADIDVVLDATVTYVCHGSDNCEETAYRARLKVTKDGGSRTINVVGDCGV